MARSWVSDPFPERQALMRIARLDHLVLTVADIERTCVFYCGVLGMERVTFGAGRIALGFGDQKINLHEQGKEITPMAGRPTPGSADICLIAATPVAEVEETLRQMGVRVEVGPVARTGARAPLTSLYIRDPDGNLAEISNEVSSWLDAVRRADVTTGARHRW
jgi:catechol 2,3-dioxygenase-like lactoylglutathione lyase family enzyme